MDLNPEAQNGTEDALTLDALAPGEVSLGSGRIPSRSSPCVKLGGSALLRRSCIVACLVRRLTPF